MYAKTKQNIISDKAMGDRRKVDLNSDNTSEGRVYNLKGQRVERPQHGLYIIGGKKVVLK